MKIVHVYSETERRNRHQFFAEHTFAVGTLSKREMEDLTELYGVSIEDVAPPTPLQEWFFTQQDMVSPQYYLQALYRISGVMVTEALMQAVKTVVRENPILRTSFYFGEERTLAVVLKGSSPEFSFRSLEEMEAEALDDMLERLLEADRRRGFALESDRLLRIGVFKTGHRDYAVMVSQPQIVADEWDVADLLNAIFQGDYVNMAIQREGEECKLLPQKTVTFAEYLRQRGWQDKTPAMRYWQNLLEDMPDKPKIPGYEKSAQPYEQAIDTLDIEDDLLKKCLVATQGGKTRLAALLQTAWALMLQGHNGITDTYFCSILSNRNENDAAAGIIHIMPVRVDVREDPKVSDALKKQFLQNLVSQPMSYCDRDDFAAITGKSGELFDHFLNFHHFFSSIHTYSELKPVLGIVPVAINSFDYRIKNLGVYFRMSGDKMRVEFVYNRNCFPNNGIDLLRGSFAGALKTLLEHWDEPISAANAYFEELMDVICDGLANCGRYEQSLRFIKEVDVFSGLSAAKCEQLVILARVQEYFENDVILAEEQKQKYVLFVMRGKVEVSRRGASGWQGSLSVLGEREVLNLDAVLGDSSKVRIEALSKGALILAVPVESICSLLETRKTTMYVWLNKMAKQTETYQRLWLNS